MRYILLIILAVLALSACDQETSLCDSSLEQCEQQNHSLISHYSSDPRLMSGIQEVGKIKNGMVVHKWFWNEDAKKLGAIYNDPKFGGGIASNSFSAIGLLSSEVKKHFPEAVYLRPDGYEQIDEKILMQKDKYIKNLIIAVRKDTTKSCAKINETRFSLCFSSAKF